MLRQDSSTNVLQEWINSSTLQLDLVASWEELCDTYDLLRFSDELTDSQRLEEYKWIIHQVNKFLTGIRKKLIEAQSYDQAMKILVDNLVPKGDSNITERRALVYQKMRQRWILIAIQQIQEMQSKTEEQVKGTLDGWDEYGIA